MNTRDDMIRELAERLGDQSTTADAEMLFEHLLRNGRIAFDERNGFEMGPDVELFEEYERAAFAFGLAVRVDAL